MDVFLHWEHAFIGHQLDVGVPPRRYVNKWAQKWRARWGVRRKVLKQVVHKDPAVLKRKSLGREETAAVFWPPFWVQIPDPKKGPSTLPYSVCMHRISLKGPISGPSFRVCFVALYCCTLLDASVLFPHRMLCPARSMLFGGICAIYTRSLPTETFSC